MPMIQVPATKTATFTCREGEGFTVAGGWSLRVSQFSPFPLAQLAGPAGSAGQGLFDGARFHVAPAFVAVTEFPCEGRLRVRLLVTAPADVDVEPIRREDD